MLIQDVIDAICRIAPESWQEDFDNSGIQVGETFRKCTGVLLCVDATPEIVIEAYERKCNLIITHHPLIFNPVHSITGLSRQTLTITKAIKNDITIYSCHTPIDKAFETGVSWAMAKSMGFTDIHPLEEGHPQGLSIGVTADINTPMTKSELVSLVKSTFGSPVTRCSSLEAAPNRIKRVAIGGGACASHIPAAIAAGAQAMIVSDCKHNHFIDYLGRIFIIDIGHYEAEKCTKQIFYDIITEKFPNFAVYFSERDINPINYL